MPMHLKSFRQWFQRIYETQEEELACEGLYDALPLYVDTEVAGNAAEQHFPEVKQHLTQCDDCFDLYLTLRDVASLEHRQVTSEELADLKHS